MLQKSPMYAYIPAKDVARARRFYEQKLGFKPREEFAGGVVYEFGENTSCFLYPTPHAGTSHASQAFWQVSDVEKEVAELKERGVEFEDYDMPGEKSPSAVLDEGDEGGLVQGHRRQHHGHHSGQATTYLSRGRPCRPQVPSRGCSTMDPFPRSSP